MEEKNFPALAHDRSRRPPKTALWLERKIAGFTIHEVCGLAHLSSRTLSDAEKGRTQLSPQQEERRAAALRALKGESR